MPERVVTGLFDICQKVVRAGGNSSARRCYSYVKKLRFEEVEAKRFQNISFTPKISSETTSGCFQARTGTITKLYWARCFLR
jgi:hypothetical protein